MAIDFAPVSASSVAVDGQRAVLLLGSASAASAFGGSAVELPEALKTDVGGRAPVTVSVEDAVKALSVALVSGRGILASLQALADAFEVADHSALVSPSAFVQPGGTRVSRLNIQADSRRLLESINRLVAEAEVGGANFISSDARPIVVQTSRFGGRLTVAPQPLDTRGLGIGEPDIFDRLPSFRALSDDEVNAVVASIANAIVLAGTRIQNLETLQRGIGFSTAAQQDFARVLSGGLSDSLPRGSVVNLIA
jgi:hypothetical protein